jgi:competence protein ComEA
MMSKLIKTVQGVLFVGALAVSLPAIAQAPSASPAPPPKGGTMMMMKKGTPKATALLDINSATKNELQALKGVGDKRAADIIKGRPYKGKDDLVARNILPQGVYDGIKDKIIARQH